MKTLHTARMVLRPYSEEDEGTIRALLSDEAVTRLLFAGGPIAGDAYDRFITDEFTMYADQPYGMGVIELIEAKTVIGTGGLAPCPIEPEYLELGFILAPGHWGRGYGTEIGAAQRNFALRTLDHDRVYGLAHPENAASIATLRKLGMRRVGSEMLARGPRDVFVAEGY